MNILLHVCCGPCAAFPVKSLAEAGHRVTGFFYNPNIQPYAEFSRRLDAVKKLAHQVGVKMIYHDEYDLRGFLRLVLFREDDRCRFCYHVRLLRTALVAKKGSFDAFTTTLLISPHQKHELIKSIGEQVARDVGVPFFYQDFREGYRKGYELSKQEDLYRQSYCGCIFSEYERYGGQNVASRREEQDDSNEEG